MPDDLGFLEDAIRNRLERMNPLKPEDKKFVSKHLQDTYKPDRDYVIGMQPDDSHIVPMQVEELHDPHFSPTPVVAPKAKRTLSLRFWERKK